MSFNGPKKEVLSADSQSWGVAQGNGLRIYVHAQTACSHDVTMSGWPWAHLPVFISALSGCSVCVMISPELALEHPDLQTWLESAEPSVLEKAPAFLMGQGSTVWSPLGWVPVLIGLPFGLDRGLR